MSNIKLLNSSKACPANDPGNYADNEAAFNPHRKKLLINGPTTGTAGVYTLDGGGSITIAAGATVILEGYIGAATAGGSAQLVELT
jgi:hypothetical protein